MHSETQEQWQKRYLNPNEKYRAIPYRPSNQFELRQKRELRYPPHQASLNLSGEHEHLPTDGTFAPYSVQSSQFQPGMSQEHQLLKSQKSQSQTQQNHSQSRLQSRQSSIHMTLPQPQTFLLTTQQLPHSTMYLQNQPQKRSVLGQNHVLHSANQQQLSTQAPSRSQEKQNQSHTQQKYSTQSSNSRRPQGNANQRPSQMATAKENMASLTAGGYGAIQRDQQRSSAAQTKTNLSQASIHQIMDRVPEAEQTLPRDNGRDLKEKWINMPLSNETSSRTHRSYFVVDNKNYQHPQQTQIRTIDLSATSKLNGGSREKRQRLSPQFAQFASLPQRASITMDQRSTTPYLGSLNHGQDQKLKPNREAELATTHQLLMLTASSIPPLLSIDADNDSQKQTQRSVILNQTIAGGDQQSDQHSNQHHMHSKSNRIMSKSTSWQGGNNHHEREDSRKRSENFSMFPESEHGAAYREAQVKTTNDFKRKLGNLKEALLTIKSSLTSFQQSASVKTLKQAKPHRDGQRDGQLLGKHNRNVSRRTLSNQSCNHCPQQHSHTDSSYHTRNECYSSVNRSKSHPILTNQPKENQSLYSYYSRTKKPSIYNFSEIKNSLQANAHVNNQGVRFETTEEVKMFQSTPITDSLTKPLQIMNNQQTLETGRSTTRMMTQEATGKFVNPNSTNSKALGSLEPASRSDTEQSGETLEMVHKRHSMAQASVTQEVPSRRFDTEQSGETIEMVHKRHSNGNLFEQQSRRYQEQHLQAQQTSQRMMKTFDAEKMQPLNLAKLDESKSVPYFTVAQEISKKELDHANSRQSCKHLRLQSFDQCKCCQQPPGSSLTMKQNDGVTIQNDGPRQNPTRQVAYHSQREKASQKSTITPYGGNFGERRGTEDLNDVNRRTLQAITLESSILPSANLSPHKVAPCQKNNLNGGYNTDKQEQTQHQSSRDQHPAQDHTKNFFRSISTPVIILAAEDQSAQGKGEHNTTLDCRRNIGNALSSVNYEKETCDKGKSIDKGASVNHDRAASNDRVNESKYDEKGTELTAMRIQGRSSDPVIIRFENLNPQAGKIIHKGKGQTSRPVKGNDVPDLDIQMRMLKKQLDDLQQSTPAEIFELKQKCQEAERAKAELQQEFNREQRKRHEAEKQLKHCVQEYKHLSEKQSLYHQQVVADFERQIYQIKDKAKAKEYVLATQNKRLSEELSATQEVLKQQELNRLQMRNEQQRKDSLAGMMPPPISSEKLRIVSDDKIETKVLTELLKMIGADQQQTNMEHQLKKLKKQQRFCSKLTKLVSDVEGRKTESLTDCLAWVKGLLKDFITLRNKVQEKEHQTNQIAKPTINLQEQNHKETMKSRDKLHMLSPIEKDSRFSIGIDNSSFMRPSHQSRQIGKRQKTGTSNSFSPPHHIGNDNCTSGFVLSNNNSMLNMSSANMLRQSYPGGSHPGVQPRPDVKKCKSNESRKSNTLWAQAHGQQNVDLQEIYHSLRLNQVNSQNNSRERHISRKQLHDRPEEKATARSKGANQSKASGSRKRTNKLTKVLKKVLHTENTNLTMFSSERNPTCETIQSIDEKNTHQQDQQAGSTTSNERKRHRYRQKNKQKQPNQGNSQSQLMTFENPHILENTTAEDTRGAQNPNATHFFLERGQNREFGNFASANQNRVVILVDKANEQQQPMQSLKENKKPNQNVTGKEITPYTDTELERQKSSQSKGGMIQRRGSANAMENSQKVSGLSSINLQTASQSNNSTKTYATISTKQRVMSQDDIKDQDRSSLTQTALNQVYDTIQQPSNQTYDTIQTTLHNIKIGESPSIMHHPPSHLTNTVLSNRATLEYQQNSLVQGFGQLNTQFNIKRSSLNQKHQPRH